MKKSVIGLVVAVAAVAGIAGFYQFRPSRLTAERKAEAQKVISKLKEVESAEKTAEEKPAVAASAPTTTQRSQPTTLQTEASDVFKVKFKCSNGEFVVECHKDWAPIGAAQFHKLVSEKFFDGNRFFRVVKGFVVQFGLSGDPSVNAKWKNGTIKDEPVRESNVAGTLTFAKSQLPNSRSTQIFINLADNKRLDAMGFSPIGKIISGMDVVQSLNGEYGESPTGRQEEIRTLGNEFLDKFFPNLDFIESAQIVE